LAVGPPAQARGRDDLRVRPAADPGLLVGGDVARVHRAEGAVVSSPAGGRCLLGHGLAAAPAGRPEDVLAPRELGGGGRLRGRERGQPTERDQERNGQTPASACHDTHYRRTKVKSVSSWMSFETL